MRKTRVKQLKKELTEKLKRTPTKSEFRSYKKHGDVVLAIRQAVKEIKLSPEASERIWQNIQKNTRQPLVFPKPEVKIGFWQKVLNWLKGLFR